MARIIILAILAYILYRLLFKGRPSPFQKKGRPASAPPPVRDVLVEDPVCHTYVPQSQALALYEGTKVLHFCSEKCRAEFIREKGAKP